MCNNKEGSDAIIINNSYFQCRNRFATQEELIEYNRKFCIPGNGVKITCVVCGTNNSAEEKEDYMLINVNSTVKIPVKSYYTYCHYCGSEFATASQVMRNKIEYINVKRAYEYT